MTNENPYSPPATSVEDPMLAGDESGYLPEGRRVDGGAGARWISQGFSMVFAQFVPWVLVMLVFIALFIVLGMIPVINLVTYLLMPVFVGGIMIGARKQAQGGTLEVGDLFAGFKERTGPLLICGLIVTVAWIAVMVVSFMIVGGSLLSIFAGGGMASEAAMMGGLGALLVLIPIVLIASFIIYGALWLAPALIVFHGVEPLTAMKRSLVVALRNWVASLVYGLLATVVVFIGAIPFGLGLLVVMPALFAATYVAYRDMFHEA